MPLETKISKYRALHPELANYSDDDVIEAERRSVAPQSDPNDFRQAFNRTYADPEEPKGVFAIAGEGIAAGVGDMAESLGGAYDYISGSKEPNPVVKWGQEVQKENAPPIDAQVSIADDPSVLLNFSWWNHNVPRLLPFIASSLIPGAGGYAAGSKLAAGALSVGPKVAHIAGLITGAAAGGLFESLAEAGSVRNQVLEQTGDPDQADKAATSVLGENLALNSVINAIQLGKVFKAKGILPTEEIVRKSAKSIMAELGVVAGAETIQESLQQIISNEATGEPWHSGLAESAILGGFGGLFFGGGLEMMSEIGKPTEKKLRTIIDEIKGEETTPLVTEVPPGKELVPNAEIENAEKKARKDIDLMVKQYEDITDPEARKATIKTMEDNILNSSDDKEATQQAFQDARGMFPTDEEYGKVLIETLGESLMEAKMEKAANRERNKRVSKSPLDAMKSRLADINVITAEEVPVGFLRTELIKSGEDRNFVNKLSHQEAFNLYRQKGLHKQVAPADEAPGTTGRGETTKKVIEKIAYNEFQKLPLKEKRNYLRDKFNVTADQFNLYDQRLLKAIARTRGVTTEDLVYSVLRGVRTEMPEDISNILEQVSLVAYANLPQLKGLPEVITPENITPTMRIDVAKGILNPDKPFRLSRQDFKFIDDKTGEEQFVRLTMAKQGDKAEIANITTGGEIRGKTATSHFRQVFSEWLRQNPEINIISGERTSGKTKGQRFTFTREDINRKPKPTESPLLQEGRGTNLDWNNSHADAVESVGGKYRGTQHGLVWFDDPRGSTLAVKESELSAEAVKKRIDESNASYAAGKRILSGVTGSRDIKSELTRMKLEEKIREFEGKGSGVFIAPVDIIERNPDGSTFVMATARDGKRRYNISPTGEVSRFTPDGETLYQEGRGFVKPGELGLPHERIVLWESTLEELASTMNISTTQAANILVDAGVKNITDFVNKAPQLLKDGIISRVPEIIASFQRPGATLNQGQQGANGAIQFLDDGTALLYAFKGADFSTLVHETIGHLVARNWMTPEETIQVENWLGKSRDQWGKADWESIAYSFEKWLADGKAPNPQMQGWFTKIKDFLIDIYKNVKEHFGWELAPEIEKVFNSWVDSASKRSLEEQIRGELVGGVPLSGKRIIGSVENIEKEDFNATSEQLRRIGYQSVAIPTDNNNVELVYYIEASPDVRDAITLRGRELVDDNLSIKEKAKLGYAFGYSREAVSNYTKELKQVEDSELYHTGGEYYKRTIKGKTNNFEVINRTDDGKVTLRLIEGPKIKELDGNQVDVTLTKEQFDAAGFTPVEKVVRGGKQPSGKSSPKATGERQEEFNAQNVSKKDAADVADDLNTIVDEVFGGDVAAAGAAADIGSVFAEETSPANRGVTDQEQEKADKLALDIVDEDGNKIVNVMDKASKESVRFKLENELNDLTEQFADETTEDDRDALVEKFNKVSNQLRKLEGQPKLGLSDSEVHPGINPFLGKQRRQDMYEALGLSKLDGDKVTDIKLEQMYKNRTSGIDEGEVLYQQGTAHTTAPRSGDQLIVELEDVGKSAWDKFTLEEQRNKLKDLGLEKTELKIFRDKLYQQIGMAQVLARYNPKYFGEVFWTVDDGLKIASRLLFKDLGIQTSEYLALKRLPRKSVNNITRALTEGTVHNAQVEKPEFPGLALTKLTMTAEQLKDERKTRRDAFRAYHSARQGIEWTDDQLRQRYSMTEQEIKAYKLMRSIANNGTKYWKIAAMAEGMPKTTADAIYSLAGYVPLDRGSGKWAFFFNDPSGPRGHGFARFKDKSKADAAWKQLERSGLVSKNDDSHVIRRTVDIPTKYYQYFNVGSLTELLDESGTKGEARDKILKEFKKHAYANSRSISRGNAGLILDSDNFFEVFETWIEKTARRYGKAITNSKVQSLLSQNRLAAGDDRLANAWKNFAQEYTELAYKPAPNSALWDNVRRAGFLWALAGNVSNAILNMTQIPLLLPGFLAQKSFGLTSGQVNKVFMKSAAAGIDMTFRGKPSAKALEHYPGLGKAYDEWKAASVTSASIFETLVNVSGATNKWLHYAGILQSSTEKMNRNEGVVAGYMTAWDYLIPKAKGNKAIAEQLAQISGLTEEQLREIALDVPSGDRIVTYNTKANEWYNKIFSGKLTEDEKQYIAQRFGRHTSDSINFVYGKHGLPRMIQSAGVFANPLRSSFLFRGFLYNYVGFVLTQFQSGRISAKSLAYTLLPLVALAGVTGLPFADDLKGALRSAGILDTDTEVRKLIRNKTLADLTLKGLPSILPGKLAFDMSRRAGAGNVIPQGSNLREIVGELFIGAPGSMLSRAVDGIKDISTGDYSLGMRKATPIMISNIVKYMQYGDEGAVSPRGDLLVSKRDLQGTPRGLASVGFKPQSVAAAEDLELALKFLQQGRRDATEKFNLKMSKAIRKGDRGEIQDVIEEIMQYNSRVKHVGDKYILQEQLRNIRRKVRLGTSTQADIQQLPVSLRGEGRKISGLFSR